MPALASHLVRRPADASDTRIACGTRSCREAFAAGRVTSIDTDDVDEFIQHAGGWSIQYHVLDATAFRSIVSLVMTPSLHVALVRHAMGYSSQGENPAGTLSLMAPIDDARPVVHRGHGIMTAADAVEMKLAGADLIEVYSAFIYSGPAVLKKMARAWVV